MKDYRTVRVEQDIYVKINELLGLKQALEKRVVSQAEIVHDAIMNYHQSNYNTLLTKVERGY